MAWELDDTKSVTVLLVAEGFLTIVDIDIPAFANPGDTVPVSITFRNDGSGTDNFMWEAKDQYGTVLGTGLFYSVLPGGTKYSSFDFTMLSEDVIISIKSYHEE